MEIIKLIGVLVVIVGLALKLDTLATVVVAGIITGLVSGMTPMEILTVLGNAFISQRISPSLTVLKVKKPLKPSVLLAFRAFVFRFET